MYNSAWNQFLGGAVQSRPNTMSVKNKIKAEVVVSPYEGIKIFAATSFLSLAKTATYAPNDQFVGH